MKLSKVVLRRAVYVNGKSMMVLDGDLELVDGWVRCGTTLIPPDRVDYAECNGFTVQVGAGTSETTSRRPKTGK